MYFYKLKHSTMKEDAENNFYLLLRSPLRLLLLYIGIISILLPAFPQTAQEIRKKQNVTVDTSKIECIYRLDEVDTLNNKSKSNLYILQVGENYSLCGDLNDYRKDSVWIAVDYDYDEDMFFKVFNRFLSYTFDQVLRHGADFTVRNNFLLNAVEYVDSAFKINWEMSDDTLTVCGYLCHKATAAIRGKNWTAWYADEVPVDAGPWKFHGLPGLILKASDSDNLIDFEAEEIRKPHVLPLKTQYRWKRISRQKYLEMERALGYGTLKLSIPGMPNVKHDTRPLNFYCPKETE